MRKSSPTIAKELKYNYSYAYEELTVNPIGNRTGIYNCMFIGQENDSFHFAIYY